MSSSTHDTLPLSILKLNPSSNDWVIFHFRFEDMIHMKQKWHHFNSMQLHPTALLFMTIQLVDANDPTAVAVAVMANKNAATAAASNPNLLRSQNEWDNAEALAQYLLSQRILDKTLVQAQHYTTTMLRWGAIISKYTDKSMYVQTSLRSEFLEM
ncbi:hypothetical protein M0805_000464, partial [Coniferiporia weirii]